MPDKKVRVTVTQGSGFRTECKAGKHTVIIDQPAPMGGTDEGSTPLDIQLMALGGCIAAIARIMASQRKLSIRGIKIEMESSLNTDGLLGKPTEQRVGFESINAKIEIDSDMTREEKEKFIEEVEKRCPISENLQNATPINVSLA